MQRWMVLDFENRTFSKTPYYPTFTLCSMLRLSRLETSGPLTKPMSAAKCTFPRRCPGRLELERCPASQALEFGKAVFGHSATRGRTGKEGAKGDLV